MVPHAWDFLPDFCAAICILIKTPEIKFCVIELSHTFECGFYGNFLQGLCVTTDFNLLR